MKRFHIALYALLMGAVGAMASCDRYENTPPPPNEPQQPAYGESCPKIAPTPIRFATAVATPSERTTCEAAGGMVERGGLIGAEQCVLPYCDAGQACSDSSECIGQCFDTSASVPAGSPIVGACQPNNSPFGCRTEVVNGQRGPTLCVD